MKSFLLASLLVAAGPVLAAGYSPIQVSEYDPDSGLYYRTIQRDVEGGVPLSTQASDTDAINLNIFDPVAQASTTLFAEPQPGGLSLVLYETGWKDGSIVFNGATAPLVVLDNNGIPRRAPKDRLLVGTFAESSRETTLYVADKRGGGLRKVASVPALADWHLDVRNERIRVVYQSSQGVIVESYPW